MKRVCQVCDKEFSTPFNLRRHMERFHESGGGSGVSGTKSNAFQQNGGGRNDELGDNVEEVDDGGVTDDDSSNENSGDSSAVSTDEDSSDVSIDEEGKGDEGDIFEDILRMAEREVGSGEDTTHADLQNKFREVYKETVLQKRLLNKSSDHKRIMKTVEELRERHEDFTFEEALDEAVRLRRKMLDAMVPASSSTIQGESDDDDEDAEAT